MPAPLPDDLATALAELGARSVGLRLLVLHGSRATGRSHARSDWDFAFLADAGFDALGLHVALTQLLGTDDVDLADLDRASAVLRIEVADHGIPVFPGRCEAWFEFRYEAADFWCDAGPIIERAQAERLADLRARHLP